jgi:hypothetical protein
MKNHIFFTLISVFSCITPALTQTVVFSEDFDGGIPESWTINPVSSGNPDSLDNAVWIWATNESLNYSDWWIDFFYMESPTAENGFAVFDAAYLDSKGIASEFPPTGGTGPAPTPLTSDLISPSIDCSELETVALSFHQNYYSNSSLTAKVGVSTDDGQTWEYITLNLYLWNTKDYQREIIIDLTEYAALQEDVRISFRYEGNYYYWLIDDVRVSEVPDYDLAIDEVLYPLSSYAQPASQIDGDTMDFSIRLSNKGKLDQTDVIVSAKVVDEAEQILFQDSVIVAEIAAGTEEMQVDLPSIYLPYDLSEGNYAIHYNIYKQTETDFTPVNNKALLPFELTESRYAKGFGTYYGAINWTAGPNRLGNQYRTGKNWTGGFKASKIITRMCCQPAINGANVTFFLYKVNDDIKEDWSNFDFSSDNSLTLKGYGDHNFEDEDFDEDVEVTMLDVLTSEEGVVLEPDSRYFLVAEFTENTFLDVGFQVNNKIDYTYRLEDNSLVFSTGNTWFIFGSGTPIAGDFVPVLEMEIAMDVSSSSIQSLPSSALRISPNPARDIVQIQVDSESASIALLTLANSQGKIIRQQSTSGSSMEKWSVTGLPAGVYYLRLSTDKGSLTKNVVIY